MNSDPLAPHLDALLERTEQQKEAVEAARQQEERAAAVEAVTRLDALAANPDVQWFIETFLRPLVKKESDACHDPKRAILQGAKHAERYEIAREMVEMLVNEQRRAQSVIDSIVAAENS